MKQQVKKLMAFLLASVMMFVMIACNNTTATEKETAQETTKVSESKETKVEATEKEVETQAPQESSKLTVAVLVGSSKENAEFSPYLNWVKRAYDNWDLKDQVELEIEEVYGSASDFLTKIQLEISSANTCPDIIWEDSFQLTADVAAGLIADITPYVTSWDSWNDGTVVEAMKSQVSIGGNVYAIPSTTDARGLVYNKKVFIEAGILSAYEDEWQPKNWEEVMDALYTIRDKTDAVPFWSPMSAAEGEGTSMHNFET